MDFNDSLLSINPYESEAFKNPIEDGADKDQDLTLIYKESRFYQYRNCATCSIHRLPKSSHCATCNNCVRGYDHHCTLLNNCVGKRTRRAFMIMLIFTTIFYLVSGVIAGIAVLYEPYAKEYRDDKNIDFNYDLIVNAILVCLQIIKFVLLCCMARCVNFSVSVIWIIIEAVIVIGLAISTLKYHTIAAAPMLSLGLSFMIFVWPLLWQHLNLIAHHLTEKEFHARLETMNKLQVEDRLI